MKKKGFTLIELLAVIVILAIIALIATPTILSVIEKARKGATEQSALGYIDAIEKQIMINDTNNIQELKDGTYLVEDINISYKGKGPTKGTVTIKKGEVTTTNLCFKTYSVDYDGTKATISNNNYCKEDKVILKEKENINEIAIENKKAVIDLTNYTDYTNIHCNNNAKLEIENNQLIVTNIIGEVTCQLDKTLEDTFSNLDDSSNSIMMLSDDTIKNTISVNSSLILNLENYTINSHISDDINGNSLFSINKNGTIVVNSKAKGKIISNDCHIFRMSRSTSNLIINNGTYENKKNAACNIIFIPANDSTTIINNGIFTSNVSSLISLQGNSNIIVNNGDFIVNNVPKNNINLAGGNLTIYNGHFLNTYEFTEGGYSIIYISNKGKLKITGNSSKECREDNLNNGLCFYSYINGIRHAGTEIINIDGATIISKNKFTISSTDSGILNIKNSNLISNVENYNFSTVYNASNGIINLCSNEIVSSSNHIINKSTGVINYNKNQFNDANIPIIGTNHGTINSNYSKNCE